MEKLEKIPTKDVKTWQTMLLVSLPSKVLREIAKKYYVGKTELAMMLEDLYSEVDLKEVQAIWNWDINNSGKGLNDANIDKLIGKLKIRN